MKFDTKKFLSEIEAELSYAEKHIPFLDGWRNDFPDHGGVYVIWEGSTPVYVGETSGIRSRMADLMRPYNHAFTKKIKSKYGFKELGTLRKYITENYKMSYIPVELGRAEIEEYLILKWRKTLINKIATRLLEGQQYSWVEPV
ncbi:hypothetical protein [Vibrio sp. LaRot3]|uniref:hypothetical protein n=1 Tax=Vibrio sp. LaRot3 TaxID=2998829 RepID=UPI0022CE0A5C|nr:hypothetical protein [Vibrio sp. LaRot3]MDA0149538.1 hypothetical protein [Vibrio sp. LaRot3]